MSSNSHQEISPVEKEKDDAVRSRAFILDWFQRAIKERENQKDHSKKGELQWGTSEQLNLATWALGIFQVTLIILFATVGGSQILQPGAAGTVTQGYNMFIGVEIMMFVGFGYLMTFMKWYGLGAVGFTMMVTAVGLQWGLFTESFFYQLANNLDNWHYVPTNIYSLLNALYAISAVLISLGAVIGKVSPFQLVVMTLIEIALHSFNYKILMGLCLSVADMGGTYVDHMFGAYFGLAVAYILGPPKSQPEMGSTPDIFALIGTLFLWIYWPSFVAGAAVADSEQQQYALVNTILALSSSTVLAFMASSFFNSEKKYRPVDIQNATLAGGVAIGCTANLSMSAFGAIMIGGASGLWSTIGYNFIQGYLETKWKIHDTCGVHNLHAMPSIIGALASVFLAAYKTDAGRSHDSGIYGEDSYTDAWWRQLVGMITCVGFAVLSGLVVGKLLSYLGSSSSSSSSTTGSEDKIVEYHDNQWWEVAEDYGRSLYTELGMVVKSVEASYPDLSRNSVIAGLNGVNVDQAVSDFSSHHGRKPKAVASIGDILSLSGHSKHSSHSKGVMLVATSEIDNSLIAASGQMQNV